MGLQQSIQNESIAGFIYINAIVTICNSISTVLVKAAHVQSLQNSRCTLDTNVLICVYVSWRFLDTVRLLLCLLEPILT
jgi:hypothetical protein